MYLILLGWNKIKKRNNTFNWSLAFNVQLNGNANQLIQLMRTIVLNVSIVTGILSLKYIRGKDKLRSVYCVI